MSSIIFTPDVTLDTPGLVIICASVGPSCVCWLCRTGRQAQLLWGLLDHHHYMLGGLLDHHHYLLGGASEIIIIIYQHHAAFSPRIIELWKDFLFSTRMNIMQKVDDVAPWWCESGLWAETRELNAFEVPDATPCYCGHDALTNRQISQFSGKHFDIHS